MLSTSAEASDRPPRGARHDNAKTRRNILGLRAPGKTVDGQTRAILRQTRQTNDDTGESDRSILDISLYSLHQAFYHITADRAPASPASKHYKTSTSRHHGSRPARRLRLHDDAVRQRDIRSARHLIALITFLRLSITLDSLLPTYLLGSGAGRRHQPPPPLRQRPHAGLRRAVRQ